MTFYVVGKPLNSPIKQRHTLCDDATCPLFHSQESKKDRKYPLWRKVGNPAKRYTA